MPVTTSDKKNEQNSSELSEVIQRLIELEVACSKLMQETNEHKLPVNEMNEKENRVNNLVKTIRVLVSSVRRILIGSKVVSQLEKH